MVIAIFLKNHETSDSDANRPGKFAIDCSLLLQSPAQVPANLVTSGLSLLNKDLRLGLLVCELQRSYVRWFVMAVIIDRRSVSTSRLRGFRAGVLAAQSWLPAGLCRDRGACRRSPRDRTSGKGGSGRAVGAELSPPRPMRTRGPAPLSGRRTWLPTWSSWKHQIRPHRSGFRRTVSPWLKPSSMPITILSCRTARRGFAFASARHRRGKAVAWS